MTNLLDGMSCI